MHCVEFGEFCRAKRTFSLTRMRVHKCYIAKKFANRSLRQKKGVRMIPTRSHFFAAKKVATSVDFN
jgi:hypothetical protein